VKGGIPGTERNGEMIRNLFAEVTPDGDVVWEWHSHEHPVDIVPAVSHMMGIQPPGRARERYYWAYLNEIKTFVFQQDQVDKYTESILFMYLESSSTPTLFISDKLAYAVVGAQDILGFKA